MTNFCCKLTICLKSISKELISIKHHKPIKLYVKSTHQMVVDFQITINFINTLHLKYYILNIIFISLFIMSIKMTNISFFYCCRFFKENHILRRVKIKNRQLKKKGVCSEDKDQRGRGNKLWIIGVKMERKRLSVKKENTGLGT